VRESGKTTQKNIKNQIYKFFTSLISNKSQLKVLGGEKNLACARVDNEKKNLKSVELFQSSRVLKTIFNINLSLAQLSYSTQVNQLNHK
jgi:hypothetical protein